MNFNLKRVIALTMVFLLFGLIAVGTVSAFNLEKAAVSTPSGSLIPGQDVKSNMKVKYYDGEIGLSGVLSFNSDLVGTSWTVKIIKGGVVISEKHPTVQYNTISGFDLDYDNTEVTLDITVDGTVSSTSAGKSISAIILSETGTSAPTDKRAYSSPAQYVYDTGQLQANLNALSNTINTLDAVINEYTQYGYDCREAQSTVESARNEWMKANQADGISAFTNYETATTYVKKAQQSLESIALSLILTNTNYVDESVTTLYSKGWNTEAKLLDTKNSGIKNTYAQYLAQFQAGNVLSFDDLANLRNQVLALNEEANEYIKNAENPFSGFTAVLPIILIIVGVVVAGVVVFLIIRRRKGNWDELG